MKQIFRIIACMAVFLLMCGLGSCEDKAANSEVPSVEKVKSKVDELEQSIDDIKYDFKGLKETSNKQDSILKTDVRVPQERIDSLQQSIDSLKVQVEALEANNKEQKSSSNWGIIVVLFILVLLAIGGVVYLFFKHGKRLLSLEKTVKDLDSLKLKDLKLKVENHLDNTKPKTKEPASSPIQNLEESFDSLSRRLAEVEKKCKSVDAEVKQLKTPVVASPAAQVQQAASVASKVLRHGYFKIPIMGAEGAYFGQPAEERSGAYFEVNYDDTHATFIPVAPYSEFKQNDDFECAVEFEGNQYNAQSYSCLTPGRAHLQGGRWVIDTKAKLKIY